MSLPQWCENGFLVPHKTSRVEVGNLFAVAERDLNDSAISGLSSDSRLNMAYNAALQLATAALYACGFRPARQYGHYYVVLSLQFTINAEPDLVDEFDYFRKKRNVGAYERAGTISEQEAREMRELAIALRDSVREMLSRTFPELV